MAVPRPSAAARRRRPRVGDGRRNDWPRTRSSPGRISWSVTLCSPSARAAVVLGLGVAFEAPLKGIANPNLTPEPAKAPWYFAGLQELLSHFDPLVAGILDAHRPRSSVSSCFRTSIATPRPRRVTARWRSSCFSALVLVAVGPDRTRHVLPRPRMALHRALGPFVRRAVEEEVRAWRRTATASLDRLEMRRSTARAGGRLDDIRGAATVGCQRREAGAIRLGAPDSDSSPARRHTFTRVVSTSSTSTDTYFFALSQRCPHLGCRVPFCESSGRFECPCHGSIFDLGGRVHQGPVTTRHGPLRGVARW